MFIYRHKHDVSLEYYAGILQATTVNRRYERKKVVGAGFYNWCQ